MDKDVNLTLALLRTSGLQRAPQAAYETALKCEKLFICTLLAKKMLTFAAHSTRCVSDAVV